MLHSYLGASSWRERRNKGFGLELNNLLGPSRTWARDATGQAVEMRSYSTQHFNE